MGKTTKSALRHDVPIRLNLGTKVQTSKGVRRLWSREQYHLGLIYNKILDFALFLDPEGTRKMVSSPTTPLHSEYSDYYV